MSWHVVTRSILFAASLLTGLGQSANALAHGVAHAHEAEHHQAVASPETHAHEHHEQPDDQHRDQHRDEHRDEHRDLTAPELAPQDHQHDHVHAIVDVGLKSRDGLVPMPAAVTPSTDLSIESVVAQEAPREASPAPPPERRYAAASPRAPPSR